jgi:hypothetical protein
VLLDDLIVDACKERSEVGARNTRGVSPHENLLEESPEIGVIGTVRKPGLQSFEIYLLFLFEKKGFEGPLRSGEITFRESDRFLEKVEVLISGHLVSAGETSQEGQAEVCDAGGVRMQPSEVREVPEIILEERNDLCEEITLHPRGHAGIESLFQQDLWRTRDRTVAEESDSLFHKR